jgi:hypothetical protein
MMKNKTKKYLSKTFIKNIIKSSKRTKILKEHRILFVNFAQIKHNFNQYNTIINFIRFKSVNCSIKIDTVSKIENIYLKIIQNYDTYQIK